jgi:hypothetical protein
MRPVPLARLAVVLVALVGLPPPEASAFSVSDHRALTEAALDGARDPSASALLAKYRSAVLHGVTAEDLNLHVKWTGWHHFYSPEGPLDTPVRQGSEARVRELWDEALEAASHGDLERAFDRAGHLTHHLQDMASPPHVVPVNHGLGDSFERYGVRASLARAPQRDVEPLSGVEAQRALARETLNAVRQESVQVGEGAIPWSAFWTEPAEHTPGAFGRYGDEPGNAFGQPEVRWRGRTHAVPPEAYAAFMDARVSGAVAYSRAFLEWASARFQEAAASKVPTRELRAFHPAPALSLELVGGLAHDPRGTTPVMGLRAAIPLPRALVLSVEGTHGAGSSAPRPLPDSWSLSLLSPPLWTARPGYAVGLDVRALAGVGRYAWDEQRRWGIPVGLRARATVSQPVTLSADLLYQGVDSPTGAWAHGFAFHVGFGLALGDR